MPKRVTLYNQQLQPSYSLPTSSAVLSPIQERFLNIRNTTHIISPILLRNSSFELVKTIELNSAEQQSLFIFKNNNTLPKYYATNQIEIADTLERFMQKFSADSFNPQTEVLIEKPIEIAEKPLTSTIKEIHETHTQLLLETTTSADSVLTITNTYYPGWRAWIDEAETPVFAVNLINQGIQLPAGTHTIKLQFESQSLQYGIYITLLAHGVVILIFVGTSNRIKKYLNQSDISSDSH